jgi:hypothetical protein
VAERLGVPFLDRGILAGVAEQMRVPVEAVAAYDAQTPKEPRSGIRRYFESLGRVISADGTPVSDQDVEEGRYRSETEEFLVRATTGGGLAGPWWCGGAALGSRRAAREARRAA